MAAGSFDRQTMAHLVRQFTLVSEAFPGALLQLAARVSSERASTELLANLWDEQGQGNPANGHRAMLKRFTDGFLVGEERDQPPIPTWQTRLFLNGTIGLYGRGTVAEAMGALLFVEMVTPWEFTQVTAWLRQNTSLSASELQFWDDHVTHDGPHAVSLLDACIDEGLPMADVVSGISQANALEEIFWGQFGQVGPSCR